LPVLDVAMLARIASPSAPPIMKGVFTTPDDRETMSAIQRLRLSIVICPLIPNADVGKL
jgi:hypothetical protein